MKEALELPSEPTPEDHDWLFATGHERQVATNAQIVVEGQSFQASAFHSPCTCLRFEAQGINLFAECVRRVE